MTPEKAIELLDEATGSEAFAANRRSHLLILEALEVLRKATAPSEGPISEEKK